MLARTRLRTVVLLALVALPWAATSALAQTCDSAGSCSAYDSCGAFESTCGFSGGSCFGAADGGGVCVDGSGLCSEAPDCVTTADCPEGTACTDSATCCGARKCFPRCLRLCDPTTEFTSCTAAGSGSLSMRTSSDPGRRRLGWRAARVPLTPQPTPFGDPTDNEAARLCVYGNGVLVMGVPVAPSAQLWEPWGTGGYRFKDGDARNGLAKIDEKRADTDEVAFAVKGKGEFLPLPAPLDANTFFAAGTAVTVQWHVGDSCWETAFPVDAVTKNDGSSFVVKY